MNDLHEIDVERYVIGGMLAGGTSDALGAITSRAFFLERHTVLFSAIQNLYVQKKPVELVTLRDELVTTGNLEKVGGWQYLRDISVEVVSNANVLSHCEIVNDRFKRRSMLALLKEAEQVTNLEKPIQETIANLEMGISEISATGERKGLRHISESLKSAVAGWKEISEGKEYGLKTGLMEIDDYLKGLAPGRFTVIASPPGVGKSALALQIALNCKGKTAFYPLEMLEEELMERAVANQGRVRGDDFTEKHTIDRNGAIISLEVGRLSTLPVYLCDDSGITPLRLASQVHRMKQKEGCDLVVVDYLQLMEADGRHEGKTQEIGSISKALKQLAKNEGVHVIAVASLSTKETERRPDKRGMLSDLRQNGDIGYDADTVIFLYRESEYNQKAQKSDTFRWVTEAIIRKNRGRKRGTGLLLFNGPHFKFNDLEQNTKHAYLDFLEGKNTGDTF